MVNDKPPEIARRRILVVDDNLELAMLYKDLLEQHNYSVTTAPNGVAALRLLLDQDVDAVVCDLNMPELAGDKFYLAVENVKPHLKERFIFITSYAESDRFMPFLNPTRPVLRKPVSIDDLLKALDAIFQ